MPKNLCRCLALPLLLATACSPELPDPGSRLAAGGTRIGHYRGVDAVSSHMRSLLIAPEDAALFNFRQIVDGRNSGPDRLSNLLGSFSSGTAEETMQNDNPNGLNAMLWKLNLKKFAGLLAKICAEPERSSITIETKDIRLHPRLLPLLEGVCTADATALPDAASELWYGTMGFDAPEAEFIAWQEFVSREASAFAALPPAERLELILMAIFFNPYFLLES